MLKLGVHPKIVQERLGHYSIKVTLDTYSHAAPRLQKAAALGFNRMLQPAGEKLEFVTKRVKRKASEDSLAGA